MPELWLIVPGKDPRALGVFEADEAGGACHPGAAHGRRHHAGSALAVSLEPPGGSPTGQPTGPVIAVGKLTKL